MADPLAGALEKKKAEQIPECSEGFAERAKPREWSKGEERESRSIRRKVTYVESCFPHPEVSGLGKTTAPHKAWHGFLSFRFHFNSIVKNHDIAEARSDPSGEPNDKWRWL